MGRLNPIPGKTAGKCIMLCLFLVVFSIAIGIAMESERVLAEEASLMAHMETLTALPRGVGSEGENGASAKLLEVFRALGYEVKTQAISGSWIATGEFESINTIAVRKADRAPEAADILIVSSHLDSIPSTVGANDNASGTAVLMEVAGRVAGKPSDTELRFIAFGGEEAGLYGSEAYVNSLSDMERGRIIGVIQMDMLANRVSAGYSLGTVNGEIPLLGQMLQISAEKQSLFINTILEPRSDHTSFMRQGIPAVLLSQNIDSFENHTILDDMGVIDPDKLEEATQLVLDTVEAVMGEETGSLIQASRSAYPGALSAIMPTRKVLDFGSDRRTVENGIGVPSKYIGQTTDSFDLTYEIYRYNMKWFGMEQPIPTDFFYRSDFLDHVEILAEQAGYSMERMRDIMALALGNPVDGRLEGNDSTCWESWVYRKFYELAPNERGYAINVLNCYQGDQLMETYALRDGIFDDCETKAPLHQRVWDDLLSKILRPEELSLFGEIQFYSDGYHFVTAKTMGIEDDDNSRVKLMLDIWDIFDEEGSYRNFDKTMATIIHELGHALSINAGQVTLGTKGDIPVFFDVCEYMPEAYMRKFFEAFCSGMTEDDYEMAYQEHPDRFVSLYAGDRIGEDFAESFMCFVLGNRQPGDTVAQQKINFFYQFDELVSLRSFIRSNFGLT